MALWAKISASLPTDPKIIRVGVLGEWLFLRMILFAKQIESDGHIDDAQMSIVANGLDAMFCDELATGATDLRFSLRSICDRLAIQNLIKKTETGWQIVAWSNWQVTTEQAENLRKKRSEAGKLGNLKRWGKGASQTDRKCDSGAMPVRSQEKDQDQHREQTTTGDADASVVAVESLEEVLGRKGVQQIDLLRPDLHVVPGNLVRKIASEEVEPGKIFNRIKNEAAKRRNGHAVADESEAKVALAAARLRRSA